MQRLPIRQFLLPLSLLALLAACSLSQSGADLSGEPPVVTEWMNQGEELEKKGDMDSAMGMYERAMNASKQTIAPHLALARLLREQKKAVQALPLLEKAKQRAPRNADVFTELGFAYVAKSEPEKALSLFDEALSLDKTSAGAFSGKGVTLDLMGEHQAAQAVYREAHEVGAESPALTNNQALSLILSGNSKDAITLLEPLVKSNQATATMRQNLALAYGLRGNNSKAMEYGLKDLSPQEARENLAFYKRIGELRSKTQPTTHTKITTSQAVPVAPIDAKDTGFDTSTKPVSKPVELKKAAPVKEEMKPVVKVELKKEVAKTVVKKEEIKPIVKTEPTKLTPAAAPVTTSATPQAKPGVTPHPSSIAHVAEPDAEEGESGEENGMQDGNYLPEDAPITSSKPTSKGGNTSVFEKIRNWQPDEN